MPDTHPTTAAEPVRQCGAVEQGENVSNNNDACKCGHRRGDHWGDEGQSYCVHDSGCKCLSFTAAETGITTDIRLCGAVDGNFTCTLPYGHDRHYGETATTGHQWRSAEPVLGESEVITAEERAWVVQILNDRPALAWFLVSLRRGVLNQPEEVKSMQAKYAAMMKQLADALEEIMDGIEDAGGTDGNGDVFDWSTGEAAIAAYREMGLEK
jgi:hypothetical protein